MGTPVLVRLTLTTILSALLGCAVTAPPAQTLCKKEGPTGQEDCSKVVPGAIPPAHATDLGPGQAPGMGLTKPN